MTPLRQRMLYELQRRNYSPSTIRGYLGAVSQFAEYFHRSPEQLGPEHLRRYQRYLLQERKLAPSTVEMRISALRFLYKRTLKRNDLAFDDLIFPKVPHKLPTVLSQEEVARLIDAAPNRLYRILLVLLYATGARRAEAARIMVEDIDSQRMVIHIRQGKGARDRDVPLSPKLLEELRDWWRLKKPRGYLFPSTAGQRGVPAYLRQDSLARLPCSSNARRTHEEDPPAHPAPQLCDAPARSRRRPAHDSDIDGS
jgi:integrase/recombinase XerD